MANDLNGQVALVTGASARHGIGRAIALQLARQGAAVVVTDIAGTMDKLAATARQIEAGEGRALALELDVTEPAQIASRIAQVLEAFGSIDILVNNAGSLAGSDAFLATTSEQWEQSFRVNLLGPMQMAQAVIPHMQRAGSGRIINIGSTGSLGAEAGFGAYTAMKHGLVGLTKTLAAEFGADGILCNTVCPGYIATDMHEAANHRLAAEQGIPLDEIKRQRYANVALQTAGRPEDVAAAVSWLAGPGGAYVTGINLPVTGGVPPGI